MAVQKLNRHAVKLKKTFYNIPKTNNFTESYKQPVLRRLQLELHKKVKHKSDPLIHHDSWTFLFHSKLFLQSPSRINERKQEIRPQEMKSGSGSSGNGSKMPHLDLYLSLNVSVFHFCSPFSITPFLFILPIILSKRNVSGNSKLRCNFLL